MRNKEIEMMLRPFHDDESGQALVEYLLGITVLARTVVSSIRNGISSITNISIHDLILGTCVFIALVFVARLFGHHR
jgi:Flp pilus assembly pilin Flp